MSMSRRRGQENYPLEFLASVLSAVIRTFGYLWSPIHSLYSVPSI